MVSLLFFLAGLMVRRCVRVAAYQPRHRVPREQAQEGHLDVGQARWVPCTRAGCGRLASSGEAVGLATASAVRASTSASPLRFPHGWKIPDKEDAAYPAWLRDYSKAGRCISQVVRAVFRGIPMQEKECFMSTNFDIADRVMAHARARPGAPALKDDEVGLTYAQLIDRAVLVAGAVQARGVRPGDRVALILPNSAAFAVTAIGCLLAGAAFVPLSPDDPFSRVERLVSDCQPKVVVTASARQDVPLPPDVVGAQVVVFEELLQPSMVRTTRRLKPEQDAYIIYTSGTSGVPKGVRISRQAFATAVAASADAQDLDTNTRALCVAPFHFDGSYGTLFTTLVKGGCAVIPRRDELLYLARFFSAVLDEGITHVGMTPTYLRLLLDSPRVAKLKQSNLRSLGLGGEECLPEDVESIWGLCPQVRVFNRYGPTETAIEVTTYEVRRQDVRDGKVPLGFPHRGVSFHVADADSSVPKALNTTGELCIGGAQLMNGYWRDPGLTRSVLRRDVVPGQLVYKSGDLVWRDEEGRYFFGGRVDDVVKRRGVRISLAELDRTFGRVLGAGRVVCLAFGSGKETRVKAFVEGTEGEAASFYERAARELPTGVLPDEVVVLPTFPLGLSGKLDRQLLREMGKGSPKARSRRARDARDRFVAHVPASIFS